MYWHQLCIFVKIILRFLKVKTMSQEIALEKGQSNENGALLLGTGLAVASMILVPAVAMRMGLSASLTGALRIALMKASSRVASGKRDDSGAASSGFSCH